MSEVPLPLSSRPVARRGVLAAAAWSLPVVTMASAAPAFASSVCVPGATVLYSNRVWQRPWTADTVQDYLRWNEMTVPGTKPPAGLVWPDPTYQNVFTGWLGSVPAGDDSPRAASDYAGGDAKRDGFASGADNGRTQETSFTVTYEFPVQRGVTYELGAHLHAGAAHLVRQRLLVQYSGGGLNSEVARISTTWGAWDNPAPDGYQTLAGETTKSVSLTPVTTGTLSVHYLFTLDAPPVVWPNSGWKENGDISISAPTLTITECG